MTDAWRWTTAALLVCAFALLLAGTLVAVRAAHGALGSRVWLSADELMTEMLDEVERTQRALTAARWASVAGLCLIVAAVAVTWAVPVDTADPDRPTSSAKPYALVSTEYGDQCGELVLSDRHGVTLRVGTGRAERQQRRTIPLGDVRAVVPVRAC
ncbi:hypothetical protein [Streptomyces sp. NPDC016845]|uniref:hypothetical protein n=1 Tax=Streptomyces sp. NPDC016845 TaxID=3364972 RepID=UPI0037924D2F